MSHDKPKIIVVLGPTACGKTKLAIELANKFNGEIVSADSRQVYKGLDIGTGKDLGDYNVPYYLIDVADPRRQFNLVKYQKLAFAAIDDILRRGKLPILVGGSGLYLQAVVDNFQLADAKRDLALRKKAEELNAKELFSKLDKLAPKMAARLNNSDRNNPRRLVRYLEILGQDKDFKSQTGRGKYEALIIGIDCPREVLKKKITARLVERLEQQKMIEEVRKLRAGGLGWKRLEDFGLEYKFISLYLRKKLSYDEMVEKLDIAICQFSKRQLTWFKRWEKQGAKIAWLKNKGGVLTKRPFLA
ncbi:MAG: tRNA dimethylallyltransferase 1 [Candidatus Falkowbacteria bacterium GW2011_GWA2_41_14]|uniref:tRNA dimethylallyltransferase n=1 Tax=Candidatus Falkowbacteria bacterium GW2011_GWA2_41_14 TaxID=1618635 RepID=A0A0G0X508_9BACT|nr:MAG: tRNA dimethylallyltransferase 1 [Candidatus Falkowbacteria bacterium GW2011_GWA2_41_14]